MTPGTRDKILIAAARMLGENPTARLSVRAVAARAGVSTGSLRHFFPTQRELIDTVIAGIHDVDLPDDPIADRSRRPADRLADCLRLLLAQVGTGDRARAYWTALHSAYIETPPDDDAAHAFHALEHVGIRRVEQWLVALRDEGVELPDDLEPDARFLVTVLNGLSAERALPGHPERLAHENHALAAAVSAVLHRLPSPGGDSTL